MQKTAGRSKMRKISQWEKIETRNKGSTSERTQRFEAQAGTGMPHNYNKIYNSHNIIRGMVV